MFSKRLFVSSPSILLFLLLTFSFNFSFSQTITYDPAPVGGQIDVCVGGSVTVTVSGINPGDTFNVLTSNSFPAADTETATGSSTSVVLGPFFYSTPGSSGIVVFQTAGGSFSTSETVAIAADPVAPTLNLSVPEGNLQAGTPATISASAGTAGTGGVSGTVDVYEYSTDNGTTWIPYTLGNPLSTTAYQIPSIQIRSSRSHPNGLGCYDENIYT